MSKIIYPLEQVLSVKHRRVEEAEKVLVEKQKILEKEEELLKQREQERDLVLKHNAEKMQQLRDELDSGTTSPKVQQMKAYIKVVKEKLIVEEKKVADQKERVEAAKANVELAKAALKKRRTEVDKLVSHKKDWVKEIRKELQIIEESNLDEIGSVIYTVNQRKK